MSILSSLTAITILTVGAPAPAPAPVLENVEDDFIIAQLWEYRNDQYQELNRFVNLMEADTFSYVDNSYMNIPAELIDESAIFLPVDDPEVSSDYGPRKKSCGACSSFHKGMDFTPGYGEPVYAITSGTVLDVGYNSAGYGRYVYIEHEINGETFVSLYAHMEQWTTEVEAGDEVFPGQQIGTVGNTGVSTGAHLHFEVRDSEGEFLNPAEFFAEHAPDIILDEEAGHAH